MARVRAAVYFLHKYEEDAARAAVQGPTRIGAGGFVLGDIEEADLARLEAQGMAVERIDLASDGPWDDYIAGDMADVDVAGFDGLAVLPPAPLPEPAVGEEVTWALQVSGPLMEEWATRLQGLGLSVIERVSRFGYLARGTRAAADACMMEPFVQRLQRAVRPSAGPQVLSFGFEAGAGVTEDLFDVVLDGTVPVQSLVADLKASGVAVETFGTRRIRIRAAAGDAILNDPKPRPGVLGVSAYVEPELLNDHARALLGVRLETMGPAFALDGSGEVVAVTDTGIDETHPDFAGRLRHVIARGRQGDASDPHGHGTHVAGSIVGTGAASKGAIQGVAPAAELVFQSVLDARGRLGGLSAGVHELLAEAYGLGARIHNHSWGAVAGSEYRADSLEVDAFVWEHPDSLVVVAAGNDGTASSPLNAPAGFVDLFSLRAPATAKNTLTVGAACSDRVDGSMAGRTWTSWNQGLFPAGTVGDALVSGNADGLAGFSSRGPCQDRRIKPDVVAPGTDILSTRSHDAPGGSFWGEYDRNKAYAYMGGTSMAAPLAAGMAVLVRQWYVAQGHQPSAALLKATLINGCRWLAGPDAMSSNALAPNYDQGFGALHLPTTLPNDATDPPLVLRFVDTLASPGLQFTRDTDRPIQIRVGVGAGRPLRVCLCFTDPPGRYTQNDLTLIVEPPGGGKIFGNDDRPRQFRGPDVDNTVEIVRLPDPTPGTYLLQIVARNILRGPQGFALVVSGDLDDVFQVARH